MSEPVPLLNIFCWGCDKAIGTVQNGTEAEIKTRSMILREELKNICPHCGRFLWTEAHKRAKNLNAIPMRFFT